jgi:hypothetical protein
MPFVFSELVGDIELRFIDGRSMRSPGNVEIFARNACATQVVSYDMHDRL